MNRLIPPCRPRLPSVPRTGGDEPDGEAAAQGFVGRSPHKHRMRGPWRQGFGSEGAQLPDRSLQGHCAHTVACGNVLVAGVDQQLAVCLDVFDRQVESP